MNMGNNKKPWRQMKNLSKEGEEKKVKERENLRTLG